MVEVICDTNFLIRLATARIKNISSLDTEIGQVSFAVPRVVVSELHALARDPAKAGMAAATLEFIRNLRVLPIGGSFADAEILGHVRSRGGVVATLDRELKSGVKRAGGSVISLHGDRVVLEP